MRQSMASRPGIPRAYKGGYCHERAASPTCLMAAGAAGIDRGADASAGERSDPVISSDDRIAKHISRTWSAGP